MYGIMDCSCSYRFRKYVWNKLKFIYLFLLDLAAVFNVHCDSFILLKSNEHETVSPEEPMELIL